MKQLSGHVDNYSAQIDKLSAEIKSKILIAQEIAATLTPLAQSNDHIVSTNNSDVDNFLGQNTECPEFEPSANYADQFWKVYLKN